MRLQGFPEKLQLTLKVLSLSRVRLAAELQVDKSLVGRWAAGRVTPSDYNLERLTARIAQAVPGFTVLDWDRDLPDLARRLGVDAGGGPAAPARSPGFGQWMRPQSLDEIAQTTASRAHLYEGFWRSTRPAADHPGRFWREHVWVRLNAEGMLLQSIGLSGFVFDGWLVPLRNQLFGMATLPASGMLVFSVLNGVSRSKAEVLDGLTMSVLADTGGSPVASALLLERIGEPSGDPAVDRDRFKALAAAPAMYDEGDVPPSVVAHLCRNVGPAAAAAGGDMVLKMFYGASLTRGPLLRTTPAAAEAGGAEVIRPDFQRQAG